MIAAIRSSPAPHGPVELRQRHVVLELRLQHIVVARRQVLDGRHHFELQPDAGLKPHVADSQQLPACAWDAGSGRLCRSSRVPPRPRFFLIPASLVAFPTLLMSIDKQNGPPMGAALLENPYFALAGGPGFEPGLSDPKSDGLPLADPPAGRRHPNARRPLRQAAAGHAPPARDCATRLAGTRRPSPSRDALQGTQVHDLS